MNPEGGIPGSDPFVPSASRVNIVPFRISWNVPGWSKFDRTGIIGRYPIGIFTDACNPGSTRGPVRSVMLIPLRLVELPVPACRGLCCIIHCSSLVVGTKVAGDPAFGRFTGDVCYGSVRGGFVDRGHSSGSDVVDA